MSFTHICVRRRRRAVGEAVDRASSGQDLLHFQRLLLQHVQHLLVLPPRWKHQLTLLVRYIQRFLDSKTHKEGKGISTSRHLFA